MSGTSMRGGGPPFDATPLLRAWCAARSLRLRAVAADPAGTQERLLLRMVRRAERTRFGREHGFGLIRSVRDYQARVPLRDWQGFWDGYWREAHPVVEDATWPGRVPYFALSSGTTSGNTKRIPVTREAVRANSGAALDVLAFHMARHPRSRIFAGLSFLLGGSTALDEVAPGVREGDLSGIAAAEVPRPIAGWSFPPREVALMADWDAKLGALAASVPAGRVRMLSGTPSWLLVLLDRLASRHGRPPLPGLELLVHGGVAWGPYRERLAPYLPPGCATREVYPASEGFLAVADGGDGEGMRLVLDRGVFHEFVPVGELGSASPTRHWAATAEAGVEYAVVVTSNAGLWSYVLGDTVRLVSTAPPRVLVAGRTAYTLSAFGEHLSGGELEAALAGASAACGVAVAEWCAGPVFEGTAGRHLWLVEPAAADTGGPPGLAARMADALDRALRVANADYAAHRDGAQLLAPGVRLLPPGSFEAWMRSRGKVGGQHKVPRVLADPERFGGLVAWAEALAGRRGA